MFSRFSSWLICSVFSVTSLIVFLGCGARVGEAPPPNSAYGFSGAECLSTTPPIIKEFLKGSGKNKELRALWDCIDSTVFQFKKNVRGSSVDRYTPQELATFLEKNFFDKKKHIKIEPALQTEFMKIKQLLVGGSQQYVTRKELDDAIEVFALLREISINLNPYMKVITVNWVLEKEFHARSDMDYFEEANLAIQKGAANLASLFHKNGQTYALTDFSNLMSELQKFFGEEWQFYRTMNQYMPVAQKVKKALAGGHEDIVEPREWSRFALLGSRGYVQYLRYYYFIKSSDEAGLSYRLAYISRTIEDLISVFEDLTSQKPEGVVSEQEVFELLTTLSKSWSEFKVSQELVIEVMKMKQLLFGGSPKSFNSSDFNMARLKVSHLKSLIERFLPYWSIYCKEWDPGIYGSDEAQKLFMEAQFTLSATAREFGSLMEGTYDIRDLIKLAKAFENLYPAEDASKSPSVILEKYMPLALDAKWISLGGAPSTLTKSDVMNLLNFGTRFYSNYLYYHYFIDQKNFTQPELLTRVSVLSNFTLNIFSDLIKLKSSGIIASNELSILTYHLIKLDILPQGIDQKTANQIIKTIVKNLLVKPDVRIAGHAPNGLTVQSIEVLRREFQIWLDTEIFIARLTEGWSSSGRISAKDLLNAIENEHSSLKKSVYLDEGLKELTQSIYSPVPMTLDPQGRLIISNKLEQFYTINSLKQVNLARQISRLLIRSFARETKRIHSYSGLNLPEVKENYAELKSVFVKLGLLEERDIAFGESRFRDANLFSPHSNGDDLASYAELTDLIGMIMSGLKINDKLKVDLRYDCLEGVNNPKDATLVSLDCATQSYKKSMAVHLGATPEFLKYLRIAQENGELDLFILNIFKSAGYVANPRKLVRWGDLSMAPHVVQYIEMLMARFDKNKDGAITTAEAMRAFELFKGLLREYADADIKNGSLQEKDLPSVFCFMLTYGKPPETIKEKVLYYFKWKGKGADDLNVWADRGSLAKVLGYVADKTAKVPSTEIPDINKELSK